ncbi:Catalase [Trichinella spiralis]|uniref:Catalase n=1 Tax=Trichinella spiralis TaxID=6334 RepID=A0ABR3K3E6_TRISP
MACNRLAAAVLSASPEMDEPKRKHETKTTSLKWINQSSKYADGLAIHELPEVSYQATGWLFSNQQKHHEAC